MLQQLWLCWVLNYQHGLLRVPAAQSSFRVKFAHNTSILSPLVHWFLFGGFFSQELSHSYHTGNVVLWEGAELCHDFSGTDSIVSRGKVGVWGVKGVVQTDTLGAAWSPAAADTALWETQQVRLELENKSRQS